MPLDFLHELWFRRKQKKEARRALKDFLDRTGVCATLVYSPVVGELQMFLDPARAEEHKARMHAAGARPDSRETSPSAELTELRESLSVLTAYRRDVPRSGVKVLEIFALLPRRESETGRWLWLTPVREVVHYTDTSRYLWGAKLYTRRHVTMTKTIQANRLEARR